MAQEPEFKHNWFAEHVDLWEEHLSKMRWRCPVCCESFATLDVDHDCQDVPLENGMSSYLEIGCADGQSMTWVLTRFDIREAYGIDPWDTQPTRGRGGDFKEYRQRFFRNMDRFIENETLRVFVEPSFDFLRNEHTVIPDGSIDLCYVDGAHRAWDTFGDMMLAWPKLRPGNRDGVGGGVMIVDDCQRRWLNGKPLVLPAVHSFVTVFDSRYHIFWWKPHQIAFQKIK